MTDFGPKVATNGDGVAAGISVQTRSGDPLIGARLGPYRIDRLLGAGGMGAVYLGVDVALARRAAIKVLSMMSPRSVARFVDEARQQARLDHPHIVSVYGAGTEIVAGLETHYIALQYVEGKSLSELVREHGALDMLSATDLMLDAARGLYYVHAEGILHRDVKPANILVDVADRALLADFGVARGPESGGFTTDGEFIGTSSFASPEQLARRELDERSDLFGLGTCFHFALTGAEPEAPSGKLGELPRFPVDEAWPPAVRYVLERLLARDANDRFETALDAIDALERARRALTRAEDEPELDEEPARNGIGFLAILGLTFLVVIAFGIAFGPGLFDAGEAEAPRLSVDVEVPARPEPLEPPESTARVAEIAPPAPSALTEIQRVPVTPQIPPLVAEARKLVAEWGLRIEAAHGPDAPDSLGDRVALVTAGPIDALAALERQALFDEDDELLGELDGAMIRFAPKASDALDRIEVGPFSRAAGDIHFDALPVTNLQYFAFLLGLVRNDERRFLKPLEVQPDLASCRWIEFRAPRPIRRPCFEGLFAPVVALSELAISEFAISRHKRVPSREEWEAMVAPWLVEGGIGRPSNVLERFLWDDAVFYAGGVTPTERAVVFRSISVRPTQRALRLVRGLR